MHELQKPRRRVAFRPRNLVGVTQAMLLALSFAQNAIAQEGQPESPSVKDTASQRFEFGLTSGLTLGKIGEFRNEDSAKLFIGTSVTAALRPWFAFGAAIEFLDAFQNNGHDCHGCVRRGILTLVHGESRLRLGTEHVRLFGRFAVGPMFAVGTDERTSRGTLTRASVGLDLRLWHVYVRPLASITMMSESTSQSGPGLEVGALF